MSDNVIEKAVVSLEQAGMADMSKNVSNIMQQVGRMTITNDDEYAKGGDMIKIITTQKNKLEDARKVLVGPLNEHVKFINNEFKKQTSQLDDAVKSARQKMSAYAVEQEKKRMAEERERKAREEQAALELAAKAEQMGMKDTAEEVLNKAVEAPTADTRQKTVRGNYGSTTFVKKVKKWKVVEANKVPREYLQLNEQKITQAMRDDVPVPGIEYYEDTQVGVR